MEVDFSLFFGKSLNSLKVNMIFLIMKMLGGGIGEWKVMMMKVKPLIHKVLYSMSVPPLKYFLVQRGKNNTRIKKLIVVNWELSTMG